MSEPVFVPKTPDDSVNVSKEHPLGSFIRLLLGILAAVAGLYAVLGIATNIAIRLIPQETERSLFSTGVIQKKFRSPTHWDGKAQVESLIQQLISNSSYAAPQSIQAACSKEVNAFAFPGEHLVLTLGMLHDIHTEIGMAFVLAHELGHIQSHHPLKSLGRTFSWGIATLLLRLANDSLLSDVISNTAGLTQLKFSRDQEREADDLALNMIARTYGQLAGAEELFQLLTQKNGSESAIATAFVSTHPGPTERLVRIQNDPRFHMGEATAGTKPAPWDVPLPDCGDP